MAPFATGPEDIVSWTEQDASVLMSVRAPLVEDMSWLLGWPAAFATATSFPLVFPDNAIEEL